MAASIQLKRGATAKVAAYTALSGEMVLDTTTNKLYVGDGSTAGGKAPAVGSADKLATARAIQTNLASTSSASFDGSAAIAPGITGTLPIANGGTGGTSVTAILTNLGQKYASGVLTVPTSSSTVKVVGGTSVVTTNSSSQASISFPAAFSTTALSIMVCAGDASGSDYTVSVVSFVPASNLASFTVYLSNSVSVTRRVNWIAMGI